MSFESQPESILHPEIAQELEAMVKIDQDMRERCGVEEPLDETIDKSNTERMKQIVAEIGWPTISKVGPDGAFHAWLLVQHAVHDVAFQEQCLNLMKGLPTHEIDREDIAYLEDRVRLNKGLGQLYGTQFTLENGRWVPRTIEDKEGINERRAEIGMGPLSEQIELIYRKYPLNTTAPPQK